MVQQRRGRAARRPAGARRRGRLRPPPEDESGFPFVSKWGQDPLWISTRSTSARCQLLQLDNLLHAAVSTTAPGPGRPVRRRGSCPLASLPGRPTSSVLGYEPQFNQERGLWYVDVALDPGSTFWPFVRLAVAATSPTASTAATCPAGPLRPRAGRPRSGPPRRVATDDGHVRVVVSGPVGTRKPIKERGSRRGVRRRGHGGPNQVVAPGSSVGTR